MKLPFGNSDRNRAADRAAFSSLDAAEWARWIQRFVFHDAVSPDVPVFDERYSHALIDLYKELTAPSRLKFAGGLARAYEALPVMRVNAEQIWLLLDVIAAVKPVDTQLLLRRQLQAGTLKTISYSGVGLHAVLLGAAAKYKVDAALAELIEATPDDEPDFSWWLVGFRALASFDERRSFAFLERILPRLSNPGWQSSFEEELKTLTRQGKSEYIYHWYVDRRKALANKPGFDTLSHMLVDKVIPAAVSRRREDSFAVLTEKIMTAEQRDPTLVDVLGAAMLHDRIPEQELVAGVLNIFMVARDRTGVDPWALLDHDQPPYDRIYSEAERGGVSIYTSDAKSVQWLSKKDDATLLRILQLATPEYPDFMSHEVN